MPTHAWMVRAGNDNVLAEQTLENSAVAIGWSDLGDVSNLFTREEFRKLYLSSRPEDSEKRAQVNADQVYRFVREIGVGDYVLSYNKSTREVYIGEDEGEYRYAQNLFGEEYPHVRRVHWLKSVSRDAISEAARNSMGSTLTVFNLDDHLPEITKAATSSDEVPVIEAEMEATPPYYQEVEARSNELIADLVSKLDPYEFQDLVAGVLRAMGFRAVSVPPGPDRGIDIIAHPDPLGFGQPRIKVQVKHVQASVGGPDVRSFGGSLRDGDSGLFVSTGGFSRDAKIDAEARAITLLDRDAFIQLLLEHYEKLEPEFKSKIPLRRVWVPAG